MSLHRLIQLAQKTGDRLIVHDPVNGRDLVIMDVEQYENMFDRSIIDSPNKNRKKKEFLDSIEEQIFDWIEDKTVFEQEEFWQGLSQIIRGQSQQIENQIYPEHNWHSIADVIGYEQKYKEHLTQEKEDVPLYQPPTEKSFFEHTSEEPEPVPEEESPEIVPLDSVESPRQENEELTYEIPVEEEESFTNHIPAMPPEQSASQARARMHEGLIQYKEKEEPIKGNIRKEQSNHSNFGHGEPLQQSLKKNPPIFFDEPV